MRNRLFLSLIAAVALLGSSTAYAGVLTGATWSGTTQGVALTITNASATCLSTGDNLVQQVITCPGAGLGATGTATGGNYSASLTVGLFAISQFTTGGAIPIGTMVTMMGGQVVNGMASSAGATQGVAGGVTVRVAALNKAATKLVSNHSKLSMYTTLVKVPLAVGKAGTFTDYFYVLTNLHYITVDFYAWTPHTLAFTGLTTKKAALPNVTAKGSFALTPMDGGVVTLVSPSKISIDGILAQRRTASFTTLKLTYAPTAPEPSTLLLLGAGVVGLALVGSRKRS